MRRCAIGRSQAKAATSIQTNVADTSLGLSKSSLDQSAPWLKQAGDYYSSVAGGDPTKLSTAVGPQIQQSRTAYDQATAQVQRTVGKGGLRDATLGNIATAQAGDVSRIYTGGINDALQRLAGLGTQGQQLGLSSLSTAGNAGQSLAQLSASKAQAVGQGIAGIGSAAGGLLGAQAAKPKTPGGNTAKAPSFSVPYAPYMPSVNGTEFTPPNDLGISLPSNVGFG